MLSHYPPVMDSSGSEVPLICKSHWDEGSQLPSFAPFAFEVEVGQFMPTAFSGRCWGRLQQGSCSKQPSRLRGCPGGPVSAQSLRKLFCCVASTQ